MQAKKYDFPYFQLEHRIKVEIINCLTFSIISASANPPTFLTRNPNEGRDN